MPYEAVAISGATYRALLAEVAANRDLSLADEVLSLALGRSKEARWDDEQPSPFFGPTLPKSRVPEYADSVQRRLKSEAAIVPVAAEEDVALATEVRTIPVPGWKTGRIREAFHSGGDVVPVIEDDLREAFGNSWVSARVTAVPAFGPMRAEEADVKIAVRYDVVFGGRRTFSSRHDTLDEARAAAKQYMAGHPKQTLVAIVPAAVLTDTVSGEEVDSFATYERPVPAEPRVTVELAVPQAKPGARIDHYLVLLGKPRQ